MRLASLPVIFSLALALAGLGGIAPAMAQQSSECRSLQSQIASLSRGDPGRSATYGRAAQKQRAELDRTASYANSIGCSKRQFLIFGEAPPPQCGSIEGQMQRMRANLSQLESQAGGGGSESAIRDLTYRYNNRCRVPAQVASAAPQPQRGLFEQLFGGNQPRPAVNEPPPFQQQQLEQVPLERPVQSPLDDSEEETSSGSRGGSRAVCVRKCDGGFFPVSYAAGSEDSAGLTALCTALCPNAQANVYTYGGGADIESAVSLTGQAYRALPAAFRYRTTFDSTCTCKAANQTWVAALTEAERLLTSGGGHDVVVSEQKAAELSRPKFMPVKVKADPKLQARADPNATAAIGALPAAPADDGQTAREASAGAALATASTETTGISAGDGVAAATITRDQGQTQEVVVNGVKKRVRIIGPKL